jgi:hypothetical protein
VLLEWGTLFFFVGLTVSCGAVVGAAVIRAGVDFSRWAVVRFVVTRGAGLSAGRLFGLFAETGTAARRFLFRAPRNRFRPGRLGNALVRGGALRRAL